MNANLKEDKGIQLVRRRKEQILDAAMQVFARNGFRRTKVDQIAEHINVGKGTIYRYFEDKKSLFLAVFEQGMERLSRTIRANVEPITDPKDKIATAVRTYFEFFDNNRELIEIMMQVRSEFKEEHRRIFITIYNDYIVRIQENLRNGMRMGIFRELDVENTAEALGAILRGILQGFYIREFGPDSAEPSHKKLADRTDAVTALLLQGVLKRNDG